MRRATALLISLAMIPALAPAQSPGSDAARDAGEIDGSAPSSSIALEDLMAAFAESGGVRAHFRESKHLAILEGPLESEGILYSAPPDLFARHVTRPAPSSLVVRGRIAVLRDEGGVQRIALDSSAVARAFVDHFIAVLRGDLATLRERYAVAFDTDPNGWRLELRPRSRVVRRLIESVRFEGQAVSLLRMELRESGGNRTVTEFSEVEIGIRFGPDEVERFFPADAGPTDP